MSETDISDYIAQNPRMAGVLFTICLLLTQTGNASAAILGTHGGP
ncbi:DUF7503 family protein [Halorussus aquaticus]